MEQQEFERFMNRNRPGQVSARENEEKEDQAGDQVMVSANVLRRLEARLEELEKLQKELVQQHPTKCSQQQTF